MGHEDVYKLSYPATKNKKWKEFQRRLYLLLRNQNIYELELELELECVGFGGRKSYLLGLKEKRT